MHTCACIYFACNEEIRLPVNQDRALLLVKLNYLKWGYKNEQSNFKGTVLLAGPLDRPIRIQERSGPSGSPNVTP